MHLFIKFVLQIWVSCSCIFCYILPFLQILIVFYTWTYCFINFFLSLFPLCSASNGDFGDFAQFQSSNAVSPTGSVMLAHTQAFKVFLHGTLFSSLMFTLGGLWPSWSEGQMSAICWCMPNECILFYSDAWVGLYRQQPDFRIQIFRKR